MVAVVEENCYGLEVLGRAAALVKGKRLHGFLLKIYGIVALIALEHFRIKIGNKEIPTIVCCVGKDFDAVFFF